MNRSTHWWWIRHAPVPNSVGRLNGQLDVDCDTSDSLSMQALAGLLPGTATTVVSPLRRTHQTLAAIIASGATLGEAVIEPDLIEQSFGRWQGFTWTQMQADDPEAYAEFWQRPAYNAPPGGESFSQQMRRTAAAIERLSSRFAGQDVVCVSHGGTIRAAVAAALGLTPEQGMAIAVDNLSVTRLDRLAVDSHRITGDVVWRVGCINAPSRWRRPEE